MQLKIKRHVVRYSALTELNMHDRSLAEIHVCFIKFSQKCTGGKIAKDIMSKVILSVCSTQFAQHCYQTRFATERWFMLPKVKTSTKQKTVMYRVMVRWNPLPEHNLQENIEDWFKMLFKNSISKHFRNHNLILVCVNYE